MNKKLLFIIMSLGIFGLSSSQLSGQNETFTEGTDALWTNLDNWSNNTIATGRATITTDVDLNAGTHTVNEIRFTTNGDRTVSNGTLIVGNSGSTNTINNGVVTNTITFDCNVTVNVDGRRFRNSGALIFTSGNTITVGGNALNLTNIGGVTTEFNGTVTGTNEISLSQGSLIFGATSDFSGFDGNYIARGTVSYVSNTSTVFLDSGSAIRFEGTAETFTVNEANTIEGSIERTNVLSGTSEVVFNANQSNMANLSVDTETLALNFDSAVTAVGFTGVTITNGGIVDLKNFRSGVLKIGNTATTVSQTILDTWLLDGVEPVDGTLVQDEFGYITKAIYTSTTGQGINWEDASSWVGGVVPGPEDDVLILGNLNINSDVVVNNYTNRNDAGVLERVTVNPGHSLTINGDAVTRQNLWARSNSTSFASLIFNGEVNGQISYYRYVNAVAENDLIATPVAMDFSDFANDSFNGDLYQNATNTTQKLFGPFDNNSAEYLNWDSVINASESIVPGKGYRAGTNTGSTVYFKQNIPASPVADITVALTEGTDPSYGLWNLIGNPFPSYIDFADFFTANSSQFDGGAYNAIYGYDADDSNGSNFTIWNALNTTDKIAPGQGFFVRSKSGGGTVIFEEDIRTTGTSDDFIANRAAAPNFVFSELFLTNGSSTTFNTKIYFVENQTRGLDPGFDAGAYAGSANGIYTNLVDDNQGVEMVLQALPYNDFNDVVVPLGVKSDAGVQLTIGLNTTSAAIPSDVNVYLEDNVTNTWTLLNTGNYVFTPTVALNTTGRFFIHFAAQALSINDDVLNGLNIYTDHSSKTVVVKGQLASNTTAVIYDMQGRLVVQQDLEQANTTHTINVNALHTGVYLVQIGNASQSRTQKVIIK